MKTLEAPTKKKKAMAAAIRKELIHESDEWFIPYVESWLVDKDRQLFLIPANHKDENGVYRFTILTASFEFGRNAMIVQE